MNDEPRRRASDFHEKRVRRGMYILPSFFTCLNIGAGFYAILQTMRGSRIDYDRFDWAAIAIGFAIVFDGLDGRIARMTNTVSEFGRELDSLADVITFGVAPALLAFTWGFAHLATENLPASGIEKITEIGGFLAFLFLICGASRLARFNISKNPQPKNPGRPGRKYFVGMPIPAGAGVVVAMVHFNPEPLTTWWVALLWAALVGFTGFLMVSTWRFYSGKDINLRQRHPFWGIILIAGLIALIRWFSQPVLLSIALAYMSSGIFFRITYAMRRKPPLPPAADPDVTIA